VKSGIKTEKLKAVITEHYLFRLKLVVAFQSRSLTSYDSTIIEANTSGSIILLATPNSVNDDMMIHDWASLGHNIPVFISYFD